MYRRGVSFALLAVLIFQLAVGMFLPIAHGASGSAILQSTQASADEQACPEHPGKGSMAHPAGNQSPVDPSGRHPGPVPNHDCCHSFGCLFHCGHAPVAAELVAVRVVRTVNDVLPPASTGAVAIRPHELFRPPIA
jgi:hypothetical protein